MINFTTGDYFLLRTPLLPYKTEWEAILENFDRPEVQEAIYLASNSLHSAIKAIKSGEITDEEKIKKAERKFLNYLQRMSYRCTPFGLFAGISLGKVADKNNLVIPQLTQTEKHVRVDMDYQELIARKLIAIPYIKQNLKFYPNDTVYVVGDEVRYIECEYKNERKYKLSSVMNSEVLDIIFEKARSGATIRDIAELLMELDHDIVYEEAAEFIEEMVDNGLLISELEPGIYGDQDFFDQLVENINRICLENNDDFAGLKNHLTLLSNKLLSLKASWGDNTAAYKEIESIINGIAANKDKNTLLQVDVYKKSDTLEIDKDGVESFKKVINALYLINKIDKNEDLKKFAEKFYDRYEEKALPFMQVLDSELGVGFPVDDYESTDNTPILNEIMAMPQNMEGGQTFSSTVNRGVEGLLLEKYHESQLNKSKVIRFTYDEIAAKVKRTGNQIPASVFAHCAAFLDESNQLKFHYKYASENIEKIAGRFCYMDKEMHEAVKSDIDAKDQKTPDKIVAEIVHLPKSRVGNILKRTKLRDYSIPIMGSPESENKIQLDDLLVSVSAVGEISLFSKKHGKEVVPKMSNAHNYQGFNFLSYYKFLCALSNEPDKTNLGWNWGRLAGLHFLPRVEIENVVVESAKWKLNYNQFNSLNDKFDFVKVKEILSSLGLPGLFLIVEGDNEIPIELNSETSLLTFWNTLKRDKRLTISEVLFDTDNLIVNDGENGYTNEIIIPFNRSDIKKNDEGGSLSDPRKVEKVQRSFYPGSEWVYFKLYSGIKSGDKILNHVITPFVDFCKKQGIIDKWFFLRYGDPDTHLRFRVRLTDLNHYSQVFQLFHSVCQDFVEQGIIWKIQVDTYKRELERYSEDNIEYSEEWFTYDSDVISKFIFTYSDEEDFNALRWKSALIGIDEILNVFSYNLQQKKNLLGYIAESFQEEFALNNKQGREQLKKLNRNHKKDLKNVFEESANGSIFYEIREMFKERSVISLDCVHNILMTEEKGQFGLNNLISSYIHMFVNRLMRSNQRKYEVILYDLLNQYYTSQLMKEKYQKKVLV